MNIFGEGSMNIKTKWIIGSFVLLAVVAFVLIAARNFSVTAADNNRQDAAYWTCGMHPQVRQDKPGKCPVCQMPLVPVAEGQAKGLDQEDARYYGCGVKEEGHCPHCDKGQKDSQCICGGHSFVEKGHALKKCPVCKKTLNEIPDKDALRSRDDAAQQPKGKDKNKVLFYRNPMNPQITSPAPMKDEMGMDYIPVYEGQEGGQAKEEGVVSRVHIRQEQAQLAGVVIEPVSKIALFKEIRAVGKIAYDPDLAVSQEEFLTALETRQKVSNSPDPAVIERAQDLLQKSRFKLRLLGMSDEEIDELEADRKAQMSLVLPEDKAWVYADIFEYDLSWVRQGEAAKVTTTAYPGEVFQGIIKSISPVLDPKTRTARIRLQIDNPEKKLKPEMYANVVIQSVYKGSGGDKEVLAVPQEAVLDTGVRKIVYVDAGNGTFLGKEVKLGPLASAAVNGRQQPFYPVLEGLEAGERIVTKGNFLIDSQSQLSGGMSVLWGGSQEIGTEEQGAQKAGPVETQHRH